VEREQKIKAREHVRAQKVEAGEVLARRGEPAHSMYC
jgi:CRP-like cAMP-binding protein